MERAGVGRRYAFTEGDGLANSSPAIVAVSKTHPAEVITAGLIAGIQNFGENYAQELKEKNDIINQSALPQKPIWHYIGHLQTNKVKLIAPFVNMIHSVDTSKLATEISHHAESNSRKIEILLQVNTSGELSKSGCSPADVFSLAETIMKIKNINIAGLMTIGSFSDDLEIVKKEFIMLRELREELKIKFPETNWTHLSMGMSGDYEHAIEEGSTIVRIGSAIFGSRNYL